MDKSKVNTFIKPLIWCLAHSRHSIIKCWTGACMNDCLYYPHIVQHFFELGFLSFSFQVIYRLHYVLCDHSLCLISTQPD